jgi:sulfite exporter TauE/SafE
MMDLSAGLILGLSTGVVCLAYCGPVLIPFLMGEGNTIYGNTGTVILFLAGRLIAYILIGILAGTVGITLLQPSGSKIVFIGILYIILSSLLIVYGFHRFRKVCLGRSHLPVKESSGLRWRFMLPLSGGFATGLNLCPPFLLAITGAMDTGDISGSILFFCMFFLGTAIYLIPLPFIGFFRRQQVLKIIGKFAAILAGIFYLYKGLTMLL